LSELIKEQPVNWSGSIRTPLINQEVYPKTERGSIPVRVGVGGTPESVVRAARLGMPMALAIIGGDPARFAPFAHLYRSRLAEFGKPELPISIHSPGHCADSDVQALNELWPNYYALYNKIGRERGWAPTTQEHFLAEAQHGSLYVGSPETVAKKIVYALKSVGAQRFDFKYCNGPMPQKQLMRSIELYGTKVIPLVREMMA
jgi:alkanesulfonate monooxygenase SsuD/methylene tetrahydromethanopterin reductase-like flavin-dependent oxidoreductase (luciferase family)